MRKGDLVALDTEPTRLKDPFDFILSFAEGKRVLNVGAAGGVHSYLPDKAPAWLHERLRLVAHDLIGIDIDTTSVEHARKYGYDIRLLDCENVQFDHDFDLIVMSDVIEHVNAPVLAIKNLVSNLADGGALFITTPNGTASPAVAGVMLRRNINVYYDHVATYYPEHFQAICDRLNLELRNIYFFDHRDVRNKILHLKSIIAKVLTKIWPRCATSMLIVIGKI